LLPFFGNIISVIYNVFIANKILKSAEKFPENIQTKFRFLLRDLKRKGPVQKHWPNFSKIGTDKYHCHLSYRYVACWTYYKKTTAVEVYYAGTRENAPY